MSGYAEFLAARQHTARGDGPDLTWAPAGLFDFQRDLVTWALAQSRAAIFADCGLGKTPMQLTWAENIRRHTGKPVLIVTPLAVSAQTVAEAGKFGVEAATSRDGTLAGPVTVTNYERLERFSPDDFAGVVCDESSAIKAFDGERRKIVTDFMRRVPYRLLCTATAAPNDYVELGTSSEALGYLGHADMLGRFFVNDQGNSNARARANGHEAGWRFKGHASEPFWQWVASWARSIRRPSDLGYDDTRFVLPALVEREHFVDVLGQRDTEALFDVEAHGLTLQRREARLSIGERTELAASLLGGTEAGVAWCHLNDESAALTRSIDGAVELAGGEDLDIKEAKLLAFSRGDIRVLVTKPTIGAWGLNWQHCHRMTYFPSHSYEQYYQAVRRCWRFGQQLPVEVEIVTSPGGREVLTNLRRKAVQADGMFDALVRQMRQGQLIERGRYDHIPMEVPAWAS